MLLYIATQKLFVDWFPEAREFQELAKQEALENARIMVYSKRLDKELFTDIAFQIISYPGPRLANMMRLTSMERQCSKLLRS